MKKGDVIITVSGNPGLPTILAIDACIHDGFVGLRDLSSDVIPQYLYFQFVALHAQHGSLSVGAVFKNLTTDQIKEFKIPLPPLPVQQKIVEEIEAEQRLVAGNRELIERFEKKIQQTLARVWDEAAPAAEPAAKAKADVAYLPGLIACYIANALRDDPNLGRTKLEKCNHFIEYHGGVPLDRHALPYLYGPVDIKQLTKAEAWAAEQGALEVHDKGDGTKVEYEPGPRLAETAHLAAERLGESKAEVDRIIDLLACETTRRCEIFATVYAAWNDLLISGERPSDPAIMDEIRTKWHERKKRFSDKDWRIGLSWLRSHDLKPAGTGRKIG